MANARLASAGGTGTFAPNAASSPLAICFRVGLMSRVGFFRGPFRPIGPRKVPALARADWEFPPPAQCSIARSYPDFPRGASGRVSRLTSAPYLHEVNGEILKMMPIAIPDSSNPLRQFPPAVTNPRGGWRSKSSGKDNKKGADGKPKGDGQNSAIGGNATGRE